MIATIVYIFSKEKPPGVTSTERLYIDYCMVPDRTRYNLMALRLYHNLPAPVQVYFLYSFLRKDDEIMAEGVRKRGKTWSYYFDTAKIGGERKKIEKGGFRTQKEALDARAAAIAEYNNTGRNFEPSQMSVSDYLDYWLEHAIKNNIGQGFSHGTYRVYCGQVNNHLKPKFGQYRLSSFQYASDIIQTWIDELKAKYAKSTVNSLLNCLSGAMSYAVLPLKYIQNNPCIPVTVGKMPLDPQAKSSGSISYRDTYSRDVRHQLSERYRF